MLFRAFYLYFILWWSMIFYEGEGNRFSRGAIFSFYIFFSFFLPPSHFWDQVTNTEQGIKLVCHNFKNYDLKQRTYFYYLPLYNNCDIIDFKDRKTHNTAHISHWPRVGVSQRWKSCTQILKTCTHINIYVQLTAGMHFS